MIARVFQLCLLISLVMAPVGVAAMGGGMFTAKYIDGANVILLTHNAHEMQSGVKLDHNLRLYDMTGHPIEFDKVQVQLKRDGKSLYEQSQAISANNDISFQYAYPRQGTYVLSAVFTENGQRISQGQFPLVVARGPRQDWSANAFTVETALAFGLGAGSMWLYSQRRQVSARLRSVTSRRHP